MFRVSEEERLGKELPSMGVTEIKRGGERDIKLYPEIYLKPLQPWNFIEKQ